MKSLFTLFAIALLAACKPATAPSLTDPQQKLEIVDLIVGGGDEVTAGKTAVVHYTGWVFDLNAADHHGLQFDSSRKRGAPFRFTVGGGTVIKGWDEGVAGMRVGGQRRLVIPPELGYGAKSAGGGMIPKNATLLFDVELVAIQ